MRTKGAKDKKRRKKRKLYAGKPIKKKRRRHGRLVPYDSKRKRGDPVKIWWWEIRKMSKSGYMNFSSKTRPYMRKTVYCPLIRADVFPYELSDEESIKQLAIKHIGYSGSFLLKMFTHSKNKYHTTNKTVAKIKIIEHDGELKAQIFDTWRISRYWFWNKK